jgi:hypothetical protein
VLLSNGSILITGGDSGSGALHSAEPFGTDGTVTSAGAMNVARSRQFCRGLKRMGGMFQQCTIDARVTKL